VVTFLSVGLFHLFSDGSWLVFESADGEAGCRLPNPDGSFPLSAAAAASAPSLFVCSLVVFG